MQYGKRNTRGFTLIELVVAMVVAAILISIAIPGYQTYARKAHRVDAKNALLGLSALEERYYSTSNTYSSTPSDLGFASGVSWPQTVGSGYYTVSVSGVASATVTSTATYTITANPVGDQAKDTNCPSYSISQNGSTTPNPDTNHCWN
jgi:type IV pilus assembly protein PilE